MPSAETGQKAPEAGFSIRREALLVFGLAVAAYIAMILLSYTRSDPAFNNTFEQEDVENLGGVVGSHVSDLLLNGFGFTAFLIIPMILLGCSLVYRGHADGEARELSEHVSQAMGFVLFLLASSALETMRFYSHGFELPGPPGGVVGYGIGKIFLGSVGFQGGTLFLVATWVIGLCLFTGISVVSFVRCVGAVITLRVVRWAWKIAEGAKESRGRARKPEEAAQAPKEPVMEKSGPPPAPKVRAEPVFDTSPVAPERGPPPSAPAPKTAAKRKPAAPDYFLPGTSLLAPAADQSDKTPGADELAQKSALIEEKLRDFGVEVRVTEARSGPVVTRFEIEPSVGVKGSQIMNLSKDLARSLSVLGIRVLETIEGKSTMGLEIPNPDRQTVYLSEIVESKEFADLASPLAIALGKDISGYPFVADLQATPHLLVAGTTGSGKSVSVNAMVLSLLYKSGPDEVKMIMIDPKMLELSVYEGIPHLMAPVVTDMEHSRTALEWCVGEMERRYKLMAALGVRNIGGLNEMVAKGQKKGDPLTDPDRDGEEIGHMPYIVVIVDELADLMMVAGKKIEGLISRLAQKARASGIHLILATQRPSVDVITGLIKANVPSRIAFQVSSKVDSRTILDQMGAETLLGRGDMLYLPISAPAPHRIHGAFVSDEEVLSVVKHLKETHPTARGDLDFSKITAESAAGDAGGGASSDAESDPLYDQAVESVLKSRRASISSVQRQLRIGYNRSARLIEAMEAAGLVSSPDPQGNRTVLAEPGGPDPAG